ncbi:MAG: aminomethyl-transferring glycine dehydrogenase [Prevotellaceae bacterium]|jgi:glycine dehydrogenase|nr:aminomethyl-transferring glycine dehydrogenase [Prevotellaceae bacterium]
MLPFHCRHVGPNEAEIAEMLATVGAKSIEELINQVIPADIRLTQPLKLSDAIGEHEYLQKIKSLAAQNKPLRTLIGMGYYGTYMPAVIQRNILENPAWYTSYTPYQAEISQGRLEALLNFQTVVCSLTGMPVSSCSLLDEATAAAEAMHMMLELRSREAVKLGKNELFVDENIFPQTLDVVRTRSSALGVKVVAGSFASYEPGEKCFGAIVQYPAANGNVTAYAAFAQKLHERQILLAAACDILSLALLKEPAAWGADIAVGSTQRLGIPMGFGGPHAGYMATKDEYKRFMPGRIIGVSVDRTGRQALRMSLQTREQHIKREKATSNICTAQALLATMAGMYAVYHGAEGIRAIAQNVHRCAATFAAALLKKGFELASTNFFDTVEVQNVPACDVQKISRAFGFNLYYPTPSSVRISFDELSTFAEVKEVAAVFGCTESEVGEFAPLDGSYLDKNLLRSSDFLTEKVFSKYRSETELMRYIKKLERRDISLANSMISLGSCTMKLNAAAEMLPISWQEFGNVHPFVPYNQAQGYYELVDELAKDLAEITGFDAVSFQPNSGANGEYSGLMAIRRYHISRGEAHRNVALIPASAHGTNPASASMAGMAVVVVACDAQGNISVEDLKAKAAQHAQNLACLMITYPSTHGVFESKIREIIGIVHNSGGQVYMDGANMNAQVGYTNPGFIGADVCHLNLHKTFAIPHGGGGPGVGPVCTAKHLTPFLPSHSMTTDNSGDGASYAVAAAPLGSASILPITYGYIKMMGAEGLRRATAIAILNANYISRKLAPHYATLYAGSNNRVAHECIIDCREFRSAYGVESSDIARRLMDYGFHAPTLSFPVHETLMVEPTESEDKAEMDRFIEALIAIKAECEEVKSGAADKADNLLKMAPHTAHELCAEEWKHPYSRERAAFPLEWVKENKFFPYVSKIDNGYGDRNLLCTCAAILPTGL